MVNVKTSEMTKIYHPSSLLNNPNQKPFFIKGNALKLYETFKDSIGFPVIVTNIAPDVTIIESSNGKIEYKYNPYKKYLSARVYIPSKNIDIKIVNDDSTLGKLSDLSEAWLEGPAFDTFMVFNLAWEAIIIINEVTVTQKNNIRIDKVIEILKSREKAIQEAEKFKSVLKKIFPGKQILFDIKDPDSIAEKVFRTGKSDNWVRARVIMTTEERDKLNEELLKSKGLNVIEGTYKDYVTNPKPSSGYIAKHVDIRVGIGYNQEVQFMTDIENKIDKWDRNVGIYKGTFAGNFEALAYEKNLYEYYNKVQHGFVGELNEPICPQILVSIGACFKPNIFLIP